MRVLFVGTPAIALPTLERILAAGHEVIAVVTRPDAPGKRGGEMLPTPVSAWAQERGIAVLTPARASDPAFIDTVRDLACDVAGVVAYGQILRPELLASVRTAWVNLHFSLLPAWRGAAPVQRALMAGDDVTGASTFVIEEGLDTGPIIGHVTETIRAHDTAGTLLDRLALAGAPLMVESLEMVAKGTAAAHAQGDDGVSYAAKLTREDAEIRWDLPGHVVDRRIRGTTPHPGAWTSLPDGTLAKIGPVLPRADLDSGVPGTVRLVSGAVIVATGTTPVELGTVALAGRAAMPAAAWWRGARLVEGAQLGEA